MAAMASAETLRKAEPNRLVLDGQEVEWRLVRSPKAKKLRIKVGPGGIFVVLPQGRDEWEAAAFVIKQRAWLVEQLARIRKLHSLHRRAKHDGKHFLFGVMQ